MIARAISSRVKCASIYLVPRAVVAINAPIDANVMATIDSATNTSIRVKPSVPVLRSVERHNVDSSCQPIDAHFIANTGAR